MGTNAQYFHSCDGCPVLDAGDNKVPDVHAAICASGNAERHVASAR
jgi:hypothetical protein